MKYKKLKLEKASEYNVKLLLNNLVSFIIDALA